MTDIATNPAAELSLAEYSETQAGLADLKARLANRVYDLTTTKGFDEAKKDRAELRGLRVGLDKLRKQLNESDQARIAYRNGKAKEITTEIEALEEPIDAQIKQREIEQENARKERERLKAEELRKINERLSAIERLPLDMVGADADALTLAIATLTAYPIDQFDEVHLPTAQHMRDTALTTLQRMLDERVSLDSQRAELERMQAEQATRAQEEAVGRAAQEQADRERREAEEAQRVAREAIDARIRDLAEVPLKCVGMATANLVQIKNELAETHLDPEIFGDRIVEAQQVRDTSVARLETMHASQEQQERTTAEQAERQRELNEQAERQHREQEEAEQARLAAEEAARAAAEAEEAQRLEAERVEREKRVQAQRERWNARVLSDGCSMLDAELDAFVQLLIVSDPWPLSMPSDVLTDWADNEARKHGFEGWVDALHGFAATQGNTP